MQPNKIISLMLMLTFLVLCPLLYADQATLESGAITFDVPAGFTTLTADEIRLKFPSVHAPRFVVGNDSRTVTVAYDFKATGMPPEKLVDAELPNAQKGLAHTFDRIVPGIKWIKNEITDINGKKWILFEMTSTAVDQDIHNMMLMTFFRGRMFIVNFNATKGAFQEVGSELKRCMQTLIIKE